MLRLNFYYFSVIREEVKHTFFIKSAKRILYVVPDQSYLFFGPITALNSYICNPF